ncbi:hypothetical protein BSKO_01992 [Bryopsis sp. KO-2023]|nr:hypothetical protein BSKO_01992 [Bryopsis sp. KO-2023]
MQIFVRTPFGEMIALDVEQTDTIASVKEKIREKTAGQDFLLSTESVQEKVSVAVEQKKPLAEKESTVERKKPGWAKCGRGTKWPRPFQKQSNYWRRSGHIELQDWVRGGSSSTAAQPLVLDVCGTDDV